MVNTYVNDDGPRQIPPHLYSYVAQPQLYSDHYPKHQNTPEAIISIALSRSSIRSVHTNNDPVRGVVLVKSTIKVKKVSIKFVGRSTCRAFEGVSQHVSSSTLFCHERTLHQSTKPSENCPPNRIEYPFEFRFPEQVQLPANTSFGSDSRFEHEPGQALPPSLWWNDSSVRNEYILEAQFLSEERNCNMNPKVIQQLRFFPSVPEVGLLSCVPLRPAPPIRFEQEARSLTQESSEERRGSTLRRLSRRFSSSSKNDGPAFSATTLLVLSVPELYRVGAESAMKISLQTSQSENNTHPPPIHLRGIRAQAVARIDYRIPLPPPSPTHHLLRCGEAKFDLFNRRYAIPGLALSPTTTTDIETFDINKLVPPTFKTYGVALTYEVKYDVLLGCAGKESEHEVVVRDVSIEPMTRPGGWLGPPPEDSRWAEREEERRMLAELTRGSEHGDGVVGSAEPPAYEP